MDEAALIVALGAGTPLGRDPWSSAAAVRAGISAFGEHPYMIDRVGEPMCVAVAPWLDLDLRGVERLEALLFPALDQALAPLVSIAQTPLKLAIALGLPSPRPGLVMDIQQPLMNRIHDHYAGRFSSAAVFPAGHAAGLLALRAAARALRQGLLDACVVAGVDSYLEPLTLEWLEQCDQLHGAGALNNAWGFIPGEAGSALLLMRASCALAAGLEPLAVVLGTGAAMEPKRIKTETVCIGEGLTAAWQEALVALPTGSQVSDVYCDLNGEPYRADEYGFAALRTREHFASANALTAPADCWGDVGAAGAVLHLMLACVAGYKHYAQGPFALAWASAEGGERAAALIATGWQE